MQDMFRSAERDPDRPSMPAAIREIIKYFADVVKFDDKYFDPHNEYFGYFANSLQRLTIRFRLGSRRLGNFKRGLEPYQYALEPLVTFINFPTMKLEGIDEVFAGRLV
jgi:hypothetical protein